MVVKVEEVKVNPEALIVDSGTVKKLTLCGLSQGQYFEYPDNLWSPNHNQLRQSRLMEIQANVGFAIYSLKLTFNDGVSPQFGTDPVSVRHTIPATEQLSQV